ncbi:anthranilate phosphoribosyltransferase [Planobacterium oryzisoli]|uniref:Anthranilate phosphoribosyltransferase n=1 Tax=Planobacterium oryzisoli TaxID=2771435 RepID=A0A931E7C5_9FLAO|nr:anthranilate phosphoribosyltransferase [Planobacterium oryzisoli]MBF5026347.1 anthranilate phosphoribosyltransferase [Planobacterium oryzisoli]
MKEILQYLFEHQTLSAVQAKSILSEIATGKFNEYEVTSFVTVFLMRSITLEELEGFTQALLQLSTPIHLGENLVDIVGTGGDGKNTFNISTLSSLIVAGAGQGVAKQGNYGASAISGASNVLQQLGYKFKDSQDQLQRELERSGFCFLHAPLFHKSLAAVAPLRRSLGLRTFFNLLGPLVNPASVDFPMIGVATQEIMRLYTYLLQKRGSEFLLVHSLDGHDEVTLTSESKLVRRESEAILSPKQLLFAPVPAHALTAGKSPQDAAKVFVSILQGEGSEAQKNVVLANAALALENTGKFGNYESCLSHARESLESGRAYNVLKSITA